MGESGEWRGFPDDAVEMRPDHDSSFNVARASTWIHQKAVVDPSGTS